jgi:hypothetical protein
MSIRWIGTWSPSERKMRLLRLIRNVEPVGFGGHSSQYTLSLVPALWRIERSFADFALTVCGVRFHWGRSYGGRYV